MEIKDQKEFPVDSASLKDVRNFARGLGHQRFQQMAVAHEEWVNGMFANLDSEQLDLLAGLLEQLGEDEE